MVCNGVHCKHYIVHFNQFQECKIRIPKSLNFQWFQWFQTKYSMRHSSSGPQTILHLAILLQLCYPFWLILIGPRSVGLMPVGLRPTGQRPIGLSPVTGVTLLGLWLVDKRLKHRRLIGLKLTGRRPPDKRHIDKRLEGSGLMYLRP